eukprot:2433791-Pyramimonas_sp.AAC.1
MDPLLFKSLWLDSSDRFADGWGLLFKAEFSPKTRGLVSSNIHQAHGWKAARFRVHCVLLSSGRIR